MSPRTRALRAVRRVDESMNLLTDLSRDALDPGYRTAAPRRGRWWVVASATVVIGLMIGGSVGERLRAAPAEQQEREQLVQRIEQANAASDALRARVATLNAENKALSDAALGNDPAAVAVQRQIDALAPANDRFRERPPLPQRLHDQTANQSGGDQRLRRKEPRNRLVEFLLADPREQSVDE